MRTTSSGTITVDQRLETSTLWGQGSPKDTLKSRVENGCKAQQTREQTSGDQHLVPSKTVDPMLPGSSQMEVRTCKQRGHVISRPTQS